MCSENNFGCACLEINNFFYVVKGSHAHAINNVIFSVIFLRNLISFVITSALCTFARAAVAFEITRQETFIRKLLISEQTVSLSEVRQRQNDKVVRRSPGYEVLEQLTHYFMFERFSNRHDDE